MTYPKGYHPPKKTEMPPNNNTNKNDNKKLTDPTQIKTIDEAVKEVKDSKKEGEAPSNIKKTSEFKEHAQHEITNENKKQNNSIKEEAKEFLDPQRQELENTTSTISSTINGSKENAKGYQQQTNNEIEKNIDIANNYQKNTINTIQSHYPNTYQTITDNTINATNRINDLVLGYTEAFYKSLEITQKYYIDLSKNYFNFVNKITRSYPNNNIFYFCE
jgi:hypothetical protein